MKVKQERYHYPKRRVRRPAEMRRQYERKRAKIYQTLAKYDGERCADCGDTPRDIHTKRVILTIDHVRPLSHGGTNAITNLRLLCDRCHRVKTALDRQALGRPYST